MKIVSSCLVAGLALAFAPNANATIVGSTYDFSTSQTGNTVLAPAPTAPTLVTGNPPAFCVGSTSVAPACGANSGVTVIPSFSTVSPTLDQITVFGAGSTAGAGPGSFDLDLANFVTTDGEHVTGVSLASNTIGGATITETFNGSAIILTFTTTSDFNALGGASAVFNVATQPVPAPLIGHGLLALLAVGSVLFVAKLSERIKNRRLLGTAA
jgi:hypothetical protein